MFRGPTALRSSLALHSREPHRLNPPVVPPVVGNAGVQPMADILTLPVQCQPSPLTWAMTQPTYTPCCHATHEDTIPCMDVWKIKTIRPRKRCPLSPLSRNHRFWHGPLWILGMNFGPMLSTPSALWPPGWQIDCPWEVASVCRTIHPHPVFNDCFPCFVRESCLCQFLHLGTSKALQGRLPSSQH